MCGGIHWVDENHCSSADRFCSTDSMVPFNNCSGKDILKRSARLSPRDMTMFGIRLNLACNKIFVLVIVGAKCDTKILHETNMLDFIMKKVI